MRLEGLLEGAIDLGNLRWDKRRPLDLVVGLLRPDQGRVRGDDERDRGARKGKIREGLLAGEGKERLLGWLRVRWRLEVLMKLDRRRNLI